MTYIEEDTFMGCDKLTDIYYLGTKEQWDAIENMGLGGSVHFSDGTKTLLKADLDGNGKSTPLTFSMPWSMLPIVALD